MKNRLIETLLLSLPLSVAAQERPNIILFLVDDMGVMDTSLPFLTDAEGNVVRHPLNDWYHTPNMEKLAQQGVRFSTFYAQSVSSPSRASIMTGQDAARHHTTNWINSESNNRNQYGPYEWNWQGLKKNDFTLPRMLKEAGYKTIHVGKAHFGCIGSEGEYPQNIGFDVNIAGSSIGQPGSYLGENGYGNIRGNKSRAVPGLEKYHGTDTFLSDAYDLVISELLPFASLANDGTFRNILSSEFTGFDFENKPYWYKEYMDDLRLVNGYEYLLAGDFFIDVLRSSHLLLFNKEMYRDHYRRDPGEVFEWVLNYEWTYEKLNGIITDMYLDKNGNSRRDYGDRWGLSISDLRSAKIGFIVSADPGLVSRSEDGTPRIVLGDTSRMADLTQRLSLLLVNSSCYISDAAGGNSLRDFAEGSALLCEGYWLGSLENTALPDMKEGAGVLPYPQLYASDKRYITATSNTANVGAVLLTAKDEAFISTVHRRNDPDSP